MPVGLKEHRAPPSPSGGTQSLARGARCSALTLRVFNVFKQWIRCFPEVRPLGEFACARGWMSWWVCIACFLYPENNSLRLQACNNTASQSRVRMFHVWREGEGGGEAKAVGKKRAQKGWLLHECWRLAACCPSACSVLTGLSWLAADLISSTSGL